MLRYTWAAASWAISMPIVAARLPPLPVLVSGDPTTAAGIAGAEPRPHRRRQVGEQHQPRLPGRRRTKHPIPVPGPIDHDRPQMRRTPSPGAITINVRPRRHPRPDHPQLSIIPPHRRPPRGSPTPHRQRPKINDGKRALPQHDRSSRPDGTAQIPRHPPVPPGYRQPRPWPHRGDTPPRPRRRPKQPPLRVPMELRVVGTPPAPSPGTQAPTGIPPAIKPRPAAPPPVPPGTPRSPAQAPPPGTPIQRQPPISRTSPLRTPLTSSDPTAPCSATRHKTGVPRGDTSLQSSPPIPTITTCRAGRPAADRLISTGRRRRPREHTRHGDAHAQRPPRRVASSPSRHAPDHRSDAIRPARGIRPATP